MLASIWIDKKAQSRFSSLRMKTIVQIAMTEEIDPIDLEALEESPACVLVFNASDPSGSGGLSADTLSIASIGAHAQGMSAYGCNA